MLILDESECVAPASGPDRSHTGSGGQDFLISVSDLTGPFTAGQSTEVPEEEDHMRGLSP